MPTATARHILVETETLCLQLKAEIEAGADFAEVAKNNSSCPSRAQGGDLGSFRPGQMVQEFDEVVFSGDLNKVLGPVKTQFGYHLIEVTSRSAAAESPQGTTELDQALQAMRLNMADNKAQSKFYDIFLNTTFCVPTFDRQEIHEEKTPEEGQVLPLIIESEGNDYLMIFDTEERLKSWAENDVKWVGVPGHVLASTTMPPLHLALNVGTEYSKQFIPDEITWLRDVVERCNKAAEEQEQPTT